MHVSEAYPSELTSWKRLQELMSDLAALATQSRVTKAALSKTLPKYTVGQPELVEDHWWELIRDAGTHIRAAHSPPTVAT